MIMGDNDRVPVELEQCGEAINRERDRLQTEIGAVQTDLHRRLDSLEEAVTAAVRAYIAARGEP